jgi:acetoin utilization deacetylase AcuC-like enzyme
MNKVAYITHTDCAKHQHSDGHPEQPARITAIDDCLKQDPIWTLLNQVEAPQASNEQLQKAHDTTYIESIYAQSPTEGLVQVDPDTAMNPHSLRAALLAAGGAVKAVDLVMNNQVTRAFCNVRPPGHHAEHDKTMGFCFFNNVAVGVHHAFANYPVERVAVIDFDVHHGNGTEDIFKNDDRVLFCSSFEHPLYPFTGANTQNPHIANIPLNTGSDGEKFHQVVTEQWLSRIRDFKPDLIFISAGFDAHKDDPIGGLNLDEDDFAWITHQLVDIADEVCAGRIVSSLEGGYNLSALATCALAHVKALLSARE